MKNFAEQFDKALKLRGMKQKDIAERTGIAPGTISNYSCGKYEPRDDKLKLIADALRVPIAFLAGYIDDPDSTGDPELNDFLDRFVRSTQPGSFGPVTVSPEDLELLAAYHEADPRIQDAVRRLLDLEVSDHG